MMSPLDRRRAIWASLYGLSAQALMGSGEARSAQEHKDQGGGRMPGRWVSVFDSRFAGGAKGDGLTDDTDAIAAAAEFAAANALMLEMGGVFAVANLKLPGINGFLHILGDPTFVQAQPDTPCLAIQNKPLQQALGCRMTCTVVPHPASSKNNPRNVALDLTGFSSSDIIVRLGKALHHRADTGRFHTLVYADAATPFHYGNRIRIIASTVPAPRYCLRYANRNKGVAANPNMNMISGWFYALDTIMGDVLIDVGDTTQTIIEGPSLIEACPNATGIHAGNFTTIRDIWFEQIGVSINFMPTKHTVANNCRVERCYFSGAGHVIRMPSDLAAPPTFVECLGDHAVAFRDQAGQTNALVIRSRSYGQPPAPSLSFIRGNGVITPDRAKIHRRVDHHGRTTFQIRYFIQPGSTGDATIRITPPDGYSVEHVTLGVRDATGRKLAWALGDDAAGRDYDWSWANTSLHVLNVRVTLFAIDPPH